MEALIALQTAVAKSGHLDSSSACRWICDLPWRWSVNQQQPASRQLDQPTMLTNGDPPTAEYSDSTRNDITTSSPQCSADISPAWTSPDREVPDC